MKKVQNVYREYVNKYFQVPKALFFGKYAKLSLKARFYFTFFKEMSQIDDSGTYYLNLDEIKHYEDVIQELQEFELIEIINNKLYFLEIQIDNEIVKRIQELEQSKTIHIKDNKEVKQEQLIEEGFYGNEDLPEKLRNVLQVFSESTDEASEYFSIIMKAKKRVEKDLDEIIWLDNDDEILDEVIKSFTRAIRKIKKENVKNKNGYIYKAIVTGISQKMSQRQRILAPNVSNFYNWLEDNG